MSLTQKVQSLVAAFTPKLNQLNDRVSVLEGGGPPNGALTTIYEYRDIVAEEASGMTANEAEWSYGNGSVGYIGLPFDVGWEIYGLFINADTFINGSSVDVDVMRYDSASSTTAHQLTTLSVADQDDGNITGSGQNHFSKFVDLRDAPVAIPDMSLVGFFTRALSGSISDVRVGALCRRPIGQVYLQPLP